MANSIIRSRYLKLMTGKSIGDRTESYSLVVDTGFKILYEIQKVKLRNSFEQDANHLYQMILLRSLSLKQLFNGVKNKNSIDGTELSGIWDPFSIWVLVRSQFEAFATFNHIYIKPSSLEEKRLHYILWVIAGLKTRQQFETFDAESKKKKEDESKTIDKLMNEIKNHLMVSSLTEKNDFLSDLGNKKWQFAFPSLTDYNRLSFNEIFLRAGAKRSLFNKIYMFQSMYAHPSNVSVFQFRDSFKKNHHFESSMFGLDFSRSLVAFLIRDYCIFSPAASLVFNSLPPLSQLIINALNETFRSREYKLNSIETYY